MSYQIISDGSCDLDEMVIKENQLEVVPFYVAFDGENYKKERVDMGVREFYQEMIDHVDVFPKTSMPSVQDYIDAFEPYLKKGQDIICICITAKFSGSYNSAMNAKRLVQEDYPEQRITIVDATVNTVLQGILVLETARMQRDGLSYDEAILQIDRIKTTGRIFFTIGSMDYLIHGGRIGKLTGVAADTLGIKPLILLKEGEIFPNGIARSRKKAKMKLLDQLQTYFKSIGEAPEDYTVVVGYGYDYEEAAEFCDQLLFSMKAYSNISQIAICQIGATIGVHTGPHPLGIGLLKRYDAGRIE